MDLKGINWVGDAYQKFEAVCLEVEETMYEDTVKFVENQARTVGASMKKFYADVVQDLLQPGSEDSAKGIAAGEKYPDTRIDFKPKMTFKDLKIREREQLTESWKSPGVKSLDLPPAFLCHVDNLFPLYQGDSARGVPGQFARGGLLKKTDLGISKSHRTVKSGHDEVSVLASPVTVSSTGRRSAINHESRFDHRATLPSCSGPIHVHDPVEESKGEVVEPKVDTLESLSGERIDATLPSSDNLQEDLSGSSTSDDAFSGKTSALSGKFAYTEDCSSSSGKPSNWDIDMIVDDDSTGQEPEIHCQIDQGNLENRSTDREMECNQRVDQVLLEDTSIVSEDEFDLVPDHIEGKGFPYKKRFRDVFSSRRRSLRKQQQRDKLAVLAAAGGGVKLESCESEWELV